MENHTFYVAMTYFVLLNFDNEQKIHLHQEVILKDLKQNSFIFVINGNQKFHSNIFGCLFFIVFNVVNSFHVFLFGQLKIQRPNIYGKNKQSIAQFMIFLSLKNRANRVAILKRLHRCRRVQRILICEISFISVGKDLFLISKMTL